MYVYIDDILIASESKNDHRKHLELVFGRLSEFGVVINPNNWVFGVKCIDFLGCTVSANGIKPPNRKIEAITAYNKPETAKLGKIKFYRRIIPGIATIHALLNDLLRGSAKGSTKLSWTKEAERAFENCKKGLIEAATLAHPQ